MATKPLKAKGPEHYKQIMMDALIALMREYPASSHPSVRVDFLRGCSTEVLDLMFADNRVRDDFKQEVLTELLSRKQEQAPDETASHG